MIHYNIRVHGKVQGVFYRSSTRKKAQSLDISGWVRNEPDGTVYIEAEGTQSKLEELVEWCTSGSPAAQVTNVEVQEGDVKGYDGFVIRNS